MINKINKMNKKQAVILLSIAAFFIVMILLISRAFADDSRVKMEEDLATGQEYLYFEIDHNITTAKYKYYGYGYNISLYDKSTKQFIYLNNGIEQGYQVFMPNSMFKSTIVGNIERVKIYIKEILEITGVKEEYFWSNDLTIYLNGRLGIKVDNKLVHLYDSLEGNVLFGMPEGHLSGSYKTKEDGVAPLNGDGLGIKNAIEHYYSVSWSSGTQNNLAQNFNIHYDLKASALYDGLFVEYKYNGERIGYDPIRQFDKEHKNLEIDINMPSGFLYNGKYEKGVFYNRSMVSGEGDNITVDIKKATDSYTPKCHHIVIECEKLPSTGTPVSIDVEYRLNSRTGEELKAKKTVKGYVNTQFNLAADKIEGYVPKKYIMIGQEEYEEEKTAVSVKLNSAKWNTPKNEKLKVIFIYEEEPVIVVPKCEPMVYANDKSASIYMKKSTFNTLNQITVSNITLDFDDIVFGKDRNRQPVEGTHRFHWFDFYIKDSNTLDAVYHIQSDSYTHTFSVPKDKFVKASAEGQPEVWKASLLIDYAVRCDCAGYGFDLNKSLDIYINIIENKPPVALYKAHTEVKQEDGSIRIIDDVFINQVTTLDNRATDPNGNDDIEYVKYYIRDTKNNEYELEMTRDSGNQMFYVDNHDITGVNIEFIGITENGSLKLRFKDDEIWTITQYVRDMEGLNDTYISTIKASELSLDPIARITDIFTYRFPYGVAFSTKQTRLAGLSSATSDVASFLKGTGVYVNHDKDCMEIIPLNNQNVDSIFFEKDINAVKQDNVLKIENVNMSTLSLMFKEYGQYKIKLQVTDTEGRVSEWAEQIISVHEDTVPSIEIPLSAKYYRGSNGQSEFSIYISSASNDGDETSIYDIMYKYDSDNDGDFKDEIFETAGLITSNINIDGIMYKQVTFKTRKLGKYKLYATVKDEFGQPAILKYIEESDYKKLSAEKEFEIDNYAPKLTFETEHGLSNINVRLLIGKLNGTKENEINNNLDYLKSELTLNVGDANLEVHKLGELKNGLSETIKWQKVLMTGLNPANQFYYIDKEHTAHTAGNTSVFGCCLELLSQGTYATGWNGIPISDFYMDNYAAVTAHQRDWHQYIGQIRAEPGNTGYLMVHTGRDYLKIQGSHNNIIIGNHGTAGYYGVAGSRAASYTAVTEKTYNNFDIKFDMPYLAQAGFAGVGQHNYKFLFNIKNAENYYYISQNERVWQEYGGMNTIYKKEAMDTYLYKVVNGKHYLLKTFTALDDLALVTYEYDNEWDTEPSRVRTTPGYYRISRISSNGNALKIYDNRDKLMFTYEMKDSEKGGKFGVTGANNAPVVQLTISSLSYVENASIKDVCTNFSGNNKYLAVIIENNEAEELKTTEAFNAFIKELAVKEITPIFIGVSGINDIKLKQIIQKNVTGKYVEFNNIRNNFNDTVQYIKSDIDLKKPKSEYILVDELINYKEIYSDIENDNMYYKAYKYNHNPSYYENSNQTISNNNKWIDEGITRFDFPGKYTLQAVAQDNPFYPDTDANHIFKNYRKLSDPYTKDIFVHRKPFAVFKVDSSFKELALPKTTIVEDLQDNNYQFDISGKRHVYQYTNGKGTHTYADWNVINNKIITLSSYYYSYYDWDSYENYVYSYEMYSDIGLHIPADAINATLHFSYETASTRDNYLVVRESYENSVSVAGVGTGVININGRGNVNINMTCTATIPPTWVGDTDDISFSAKVTSMTLVYYQKRNDVIVPIVENSFDLDHQSQANKGIAEWEWKLLYQNGNVLKQNFYNKQQGITWLQNNLNGVWENATILLRVKDIEGVWSDTVTSFLDEEIIHDPNQDDNHIYYKPIADFIIQSNPLILNKEEQVIHNKSRDLQGFAITSYWNIYKDNIQIASTLTGDINSLLNQKIGELGVGRYTLELKVINSKGLESDIVKKSFEVVIMNTAPIIDFDILSNENPLWIFPRTIGINTILCRPLNSFFIEEKTKFDVSVIDDLDNLGFIYNWKFERYKTDDINIAGAADNVYTYTTKYPFVDSFKSMFLPWGAYRITLSVTDMPPIPPYEIGSEKTVNVTKTYYIIPEINLLGSYEGKSEIVVGDNIKLTAKTNKEVTSVYAKFNGDLIELLKVSEDSQYAYWGKNNYSIPESITESGTYYIDFIAYTNYGGNGNNTRKIEDKVPINITALKLFNFRINNIVNHPDVTYPYTKEMLTNKLIDYKTGYYVTFLIDSKGKPDSVYSKILLDGILNQKITLEKITSGDTDVWQGKFYTNARLPEEKIISIMTSCNKGTVVYDYNQKENWDGKSLIIKGSALQDGRINLTN